MSVAEKLKALDAGRPTFEWPDSDIVFALLNALPQIVAVVRAAEEGYPLMAKHYDPQDEPEAWWPQLNAALTALDEALGDVT